MLEGYFSKVILGVAAHFFSELCFWVFVVPFDVI